jgi:hypothetical protein
MEAFTRRRAVGRALRRKIILYTVPGKEGFYRKVGFKRMATAMAIFENQRQAVEQGLVLDEE